MLFVSKKKYDELKTDYDTLLKDYTQLDEELESMYIEKQIKLEKQRAYAKKSYDKKNKKNKED